MVQPFPNNCFLRFLVRPANREISYSHSSTHALHPPRDAPRGLPSQCLPWPSPARKKKPTCYRGPGGTCGMLTEECWGGGGSILMLSCGEGAENPAEPYRESQTQTGVYWDLDQVRNSLSQQKPSTPRRPILHFLHWLLHVNVKVK